MVPEQSLDSPLRLSAPHLSALASIAATVSQSLSLDMTLQLAMAEVVRVTGAQAGGISLVDDAARELVLRAQHGWSRDFVLDREMRIPLGEGMSGQVFRTNGPLLNNYLTGHEPLAVPSFHDERFQSIILAPMHARGRIIGILSIMSHNSGAFGQGSVDLLCGIADTIGILIENARLYEESLAAQRQLSAVLRATADGIVTTDPAGKIQLVNPAAERLLGIPADRLVNVPLFSAPLPSRLRMLVQSAVQNGEASRVRSLRITLEEGRVLTAMVLPIALEQGSTNRTLGGWLLLLQDVTHLAAAERARSAFLHAAAHDMRNPLSATIQSLALVRRMVLQTTPTLEEMLDIAQSGLMHIDQLIDDLLALEKIQNRSEFAPELIDIGEFAFEIRSEASARAEERGLQVIFSLGPAIPQVIADRRILQMGILQYVDNAIEHAPPGSDVALRMFRMGNDLHIEVTDHGPGIPLDVQSRLFERFVPISLTDGPVTGVGLAIVKAAADAHGGSVYVQSSAEAGSTFGLIIPLAPIAS